MTDMFNDIIHAKKNCPNLQQINDATMKYFLTQNINPNNIFLHINDSYLSDFHEAIGWYIRQYNNTQKIKTISVVEQSEVKSLQEEHLQKADFIIVADADMPKSYE